MQSEGMVFNPVPEATTVSFLHARDASIITYGGVAGNYQKKNIFSQLGETTAASSEPESDTLSTYLRLKAAEIDEALYEPLDDQTLQCKIPEGSHAIRNIKGDTVTTKYGFTKIFRGCANQSEIFCETVKPRLLKFLSGYNYTVLSYGASGSGKTYTVVGTEEQPGLIPRALEYVFRSLPPLQEKPSFRLRSNDTLLRKTDPNFSIHDKSTLLKLASNLPGNKVHTTIYRQMQKRLSLEPVATVQSTREVSLGVFVSFAEIYNEQIYDLLVEPQKGKQRRKLQLGDSAGKTYIKDLTMVPVCNGVEAFTILQYGLSNLNYAATRMNSHSSRSHSIFAIKLVQASPSGKDYHVSYFNFCDLAGSERSKKTANVGDRLKESNNINTSLLVLGRCIAAVRRNQKQKNPTMVPFRESKLTRLFRRALSGLEDISIIVNINPTRWMFDENYHVLNFSAIAKDIVVEPPQVIEPERLSRISNYLQGRSTAFEDNLADVEALAKMVEELEYENECLRLEAEELVKEAREEVSSGYEDLLRRKKASCVAKISRLKEKHAEEIRKFRQACGDEDDSSSSDDSSAEVIDLDSSASDVEVIDLDSSTSDEERELQNEIRRYEIILEGKKRVLDDRLEAFKKLQNAYVDLRLENIHLNDQIEAHSMSLRAVEFSDESDGSDAEVEVADEGTDLVENAIVAERSDEEKNKEPCDNKEQNYTA